MLPATRSNWRILAHPLVLLLLGTTLGSVLIPSLSARFNAERLLRETRHQEAINTIEKGFDVDRALNSVVTRLASFAKDHIRLHQPMVFSDAILAKVEDLYVEFDQRAWWWCTEEFAKAKVLRLLSVEHLKQFAVMAERYRVNLLESTAALDRLRVACLGVNSDSSVSEREAGLALEGLKQLALKRDQIVAEMADLFANE